MNPWAGRVLQHNLERLKDGPAVRVTRDSVRGYITENESVGAPEAVVRKRLIVPPSPGEARAGGGARRSRRGR